MENAFNGADIKKLKLLVTVVDRNKGEFYLDVISQFDVNCQLILGGVGTAQSEWVELLGLNNNKAVILSVVREDRTDAVMDCLEEKRAAQRQGQGLVAFAIPMSSVIGVNLYRFLSDNRPKIGGQG